MEKSADAFRTISEVAEDLDLPQHVLRFWETRFSQIRPLKRGGNRRYYRPADIELLRAIRQLLYLEGYTIKGVQRLLKEQGVRVVAGVVAEDARLLGPEPAQEPGLEPCVQPGTVAEAPGDDAEAPRASARAAGGIGRRALEALLIELGECERILETARRQ